jgi:hypothetical protein
MFDAVLPEVESQPSKTSGLALGCTFRGFVRQSTSLRNVSTLNVFRGYPWSVPGSIGHDTKANLMSNIAATLLAVIIFLGGHGLVSAQEKVDGDKTQELKQSDPVPPATGKGLPDQAGTQEPSTKGSGHKTDTGVLVDGVLAVPGAATDGQTAPSKYSARNAEIDKLPTAAFRLHDLTDAQKREIYEHLHRGPGGLALSPAHAMVGAEIPTEIALRDLRPTPDSLTAKFPELRGTSYLVESPNVLIVGTNNVVFGVLSKQGN